MQKSKLVLKWVVLFLMAFVFLSGGYAKLSGDPEIITTFQKYGYLYCDQPIERYANSVDTPKVLLDCTAQLKEYFAGERREFSIPYQLKGTSFQEKVWAMLTSIPYAQTNTYKGLANLIGNSQAIRAVGNANGKNRLNIVVPCHRIIGTNGGLTGYGGGLWRKEWLLQHEKTHKEMKDNDVTASN